MTATMEDIRGWLQRAIDNKSAYLIIACDGFDHDNYPIFVAPGEDFYERYDRVNGKNMQRVDEVYDMSLDIEEQLGEQRAIHLPPRD